MRELAVISSLCPLIGVLTHTVLRIGLVKRILVLARQVKSFDVILKSACLFLAAIAAHI
jgi:hypothetical protein